MKSKEIGRRILIDLKEEARGKLGDSKMAPANVLKGYPFAHFRKPKIKRASTLPTQDNSLEYQSSIWNCQWGPLLKFLQGLN